MLAASGRTTSNFFFPFVRQWCEESNHWEKTGLEKYASRLSMVNGAALAKETFWDSTKMTIQWTGIMFISLPLRFRLFLYNLTCSLSSMIVSVSITKALENQNSDVILIWD